MAAFYQRASGSWTAKIRRAGVAENATFPTRAEAVAWAARHESAILDAAVVRGSGRTMTLAHGMDLFAASRDVRGQAQETSVINAWRATSLASMPLISIRAAHINSVIDAWLDDDYEGSTVRRRIGVLRSAMRHLASHVPELDEWKHPFSESRSAKVHIPPDGPGRTRRVSDAEIDLICAATSSTRLASVIRLAVETAMRRGELCALRWEHVNLKARTAHLPQTKNGHSRTVPLSTRAAAILESLPHQLDGTAFATRPDSITQAFIRAVTRAGIDDLRLHDLRHEAISRLAEKLPNVLELAAVTGHKDLRMLKRYYHPRATDLAKKLG